MEIAATGLALPFLGSTRDRPQSTPNNTARSRDQQAQREQSNLTSNNQSAGNNERVVRGEVISSQNDASRSVDDVQRSDQSARSNFTFSDTRRFGVQAAIQTFQENEALVSDVVTPRQVSGIIDVFV